MLVSVCMFIRASVGVGVSDVSVGVLSSVCVCVLSCVVCVCVYYSIMCVCVYRECSSTTCWVSSGWPSSSLAVRDSQSPVPWRCGSSHGEKPANERQNIPAGRHAHNYTPMHGCTHICTYTHAHAHTHTRTEIVAPPQLQTNPSWHDRTTIYSLSVIKQHMSSAVYVFSSCPMV